MRKITALLIALCMMVMPIVSLADDITTSYLWSSDTQFDMYDIGFSICMPETWTRADDETIAAMNDTDATYTLTDESTQTALTPTVIAVFSNADATAKMVISCEDVEDPSAVVTPDQYIELLTNDLTLYGSENAMTFTYDITQISDATLGSQTFREMAVTSSDGQIIDILVCHSGVGTYYSLIILSTADAITTFAQEFVDSVVEIDAVG